MPVTVFAKRAMEDHTVKHLLEKVRFLDVVSSACVCCAHVHVHVHVCMVYMCVFKPEHCNALDYCPFL